MSTKLIALVDDFIQSKHPSPLLSHRIILPRDIPTRVKALCNHSPIILRDGREILRERMHFQSGNLLPCNEVSSYPMTGGDICASVFAISPVEGANTVQEVSDALRAVLTKDQNFARSKISTCSVTETVDEHPDLENCGIAHRRCVRLTSGGLFIECRGVLFSEYRTSARGSFIEDPYGEGETIVIHSVEDDKLHPCATLSMLGRE